MLTILGIMAGLIASFAAYKASATMSEEALYKSISDEEMRNAEMLGAEYPETLGVYLDNIKNQSRNLTLLEYKTFHHYKSKKWSEKNGK